MSDTLFNKVLVLHACNFLKKRLQHRCFLMSITKCLRTLISKNICEQLLLNIILFHLSVSWLRSINACSVHLHFTVNSAWQKGRKKLLFTKVYFNMLALLHQQFWVYPFKHQFHKMVKHTQTISRQIADELFECVWPFCGTGG